jgi:predicted phage terminase large subunit-like protein
MHLTKELIAVLRTDLLAFVEYAFSILYPGTPYMPNWHVQAITYRLNRCAKGEISRLLINMPPRYLKSHTVSIAFIAWRLGLNPETKFICVSYGESLAKFLGEEFERLVRHETFRQIFPEFELADHVSAQFIKTKKGGYRYATSVGAAGTGLGCDYLILDDITKASATAAERLDAIERFQRTWVSRINTKETGVKIVIGQRTARDDLPGFLIDQGGWDPLSLAAIAWKKERIPIGEGLFASREPGDILHPERESKSVLEQMRIELNPSNFDAQYQQRPGAPEGAIINPNWFGRYDEPRPLAQYHQRVLLVDAANEVSASADYTACTVFGVRNETVDILHVFRKKVDFDDLELNIKKLISEYKATQVFIEAEAVGKALASVLGRTYKEGIHGCHPGKRSKIDRVNRAMPYLQERRIRIPKSAPWLSTWEGEVFSFPSTIHDDQVDTLAYFAADIVRRLRHYRSLSVEQSPRHFFFGGPKRLVRYS